MPRSKNESSSPRKPLGWGHININVANLERSIQFYELLGFQVFMPGIPYLGLSIKGSDGEPSAQLLAAFGLEAGRMIKGCIMQLNKGMPKLDLIEVQTEVQTEVQASDGRCRDQSHAGLARICLACDDLNFEYARLRQAGVEFLSAPTDALGELACVAICLDPDGTPIELIQVDLSKWAALG